MMERAAFLDVLMPTTFLATHWYRPSSADVALLTARPRPSAVEVSLKSERGLTTKWAIKSMYRRLSAVFESLFQWHRRMETNRF